VNRCGRRRRGQLRKDLLQDADASPRRRRKHGSRACSPLSTKSTGQAPSKHSYCGPSCARASRGARASCPPARVRGRDGCQQRRRGHCQLERRAAAHARERACLPLVAVTPQRRSRKATDGFCFRGASFRQPSCLRSGGDATMPVTVVPASSVAGRGGDGCSNRDSLANWLGPAILRMVGWRAACETAAASP